MHQAETVPLMVLLDLWPFALATAVPILEAAANVHVILHKPRVRLSSQEITSFR